MREFLEANGWQREHPGGDPDMSGVNTFRKWIKNDGKRFQWYKIKIWKDRDHCEIYAGNADIVLGGDDWVIYDGKRPDVEQFKLLCELLRIE
jgi:hypothetical protein